MVLYEFAFYAFFDQTVDASDSERSLCEKRCLSQLRAVVGGILLRDDFVQQKIC